MEFAHARDAMIQGQLRPNKVGDSSLIAAMQTVPREMFVPRSKRDVAYVDEDLEISPGRWLMEPIVFARLVQAAEIQATDAVLDVGCATGYSAAILCQLASAVVGIECDADLVERANNAIAQLELGNAAVINGQLEAGYAKEAPFDVIFIGGAVETIPDALIDQLAEGGRLITVQIQQGVGRAILGKKSAGVFGVTDFMDAQTPLLPGFQRPDTFSF